jgi:hypothetical protein
MSPMTTDERDRLMEDRLDTLRVRSIDEHQRVSHLERRVEELERQVAMLIAKGMTKPGEVQ